jgi:hypothetical protein
MVIPRSTFHYTGCFLKNQLTERKEGTRVRNQTDQPGQKREETELKAENDRAEKEGKAMFFVSVGYI